MGVCSTGQYGTPEGLIKPRIDASVAEIADERQAVKDLGLI